MNLMDIFQNILPSSTAYAQNRFTQAPVVIGGSGSNTGMTYPDGMSFMDRLRTMMSGGASAPTNKGSITLSPDAQAARHESVHSVLMNAGVGNGTYYKALDDLGDTGQALQQGWLQAGRAGNMATELPAYMVEYAKTGKSDIPGVTPAQRDQYLSHFSTLLKDRHGSKVASTFQRLYQ